MSWDVAGVVARDCGPGVAGAVVGIVGIAGAVAGITGTAGTGAVTGVTAGGTGVTATGMGIAGSTAGGTGDDVRYSAGVVRDFSPVANARIGRAGAVSRYGVRSTIGPCSPVETTVDASGASVVAWTA